MSCRTEWRPRPHKHNKRLLKHTPPQRTDCGLLSRQEACCWSLMKNETDCVSHTPQCHILSQHPRMNRHTPPHTHSLPAVGDKRTRSELGYKPRPLQTQTDPRSVVMIHGFCQRPRIACVFSDGRFPRLHPGPTTRPLAEFPCPVAMVTTAGHYRREYEHHQPPTWNNPSADSHWDTFPSASFSRRRRQKKPVSSPVERIWLNLGIWFDSKRRKTENLETVNCG